LTPEKEKMIGYDELLQGTKFFHSGNVGDKPFNFSYV